MDATVVDGVNVSIRFLLQSWILGSISPTFYEQLLHVQISKVQKNTDDLTVIFVLLRSELIKAARKMLVNLTPGLLPSSFPCCHDLSAFLSGSNFVHRKPGFRVNIIISCFLYSPLKYILYKWRHIINFYMIRLFFCQEPEFWSCLQRLRILKVGWEYCL